MAGNPGKVILLNGASSSGKTTLAKALQAKLPVPFWHFSIDHFRDSGMLPQDRIASGEFAWKDLRPAFFEGFYRCLPALVGCGNNLIVEHIIETVEWRDKLFAGIGMFDVFVVGLHCPLVELERREVVRGDRRMGEARIDFETTHGLCEYDVEISSTNDLAENVSQVVMAWTARGRPNALDRMRDAAGR